MKKRTQQEKLVRALLARGFVGALESRSTKYADLYEPKSKRYARCGPNGALRMGNKLSKTISYTGSPYHKLLLAEGEKLFQDT